MTIMNIIQEDIWKKIVEVGEIDDDIGGEDGDNMEKDLVIDPVLFGERHSPQRRASIHNIRSVSFGQIHQ